MYLFSSLQLPLPNVCGLIYVDLRNAIVSCRAEEVSLLCLFLLEVRPLNLWFANFLSKHGTLFIKQNLTSKSCSVHKKMKAEPYQFKSRGLQRGLLSPKLICMYPLNVPR